MTKTKPRTIEEIKEEFKFRMGNNLKDLGELGQYVPLGFATALLGEFIEQQTKEAEERGMQKVVELVEPIFKELLDNEELNGEGDGECYTHIGSDWLFITYKKLKQFKN